ncbi:hypothetical protein Pmar_PMAR024483, partial [Perkinsus marinus ATCC 50983]
LFRRCLGSNLSEKERSRPWLFLDPLSAPVELNHPRVLSTIMLFFMILFVYFVMSPISSFVMAMAFSFFSLVYKNQFAVVYAPSCDTKGELWTRAIRFILACLISAEFTVMGVLAIKEAAVVAPLMLPLFIGTMIVLQSYSGVISRSVISKWHHLYRPKSSSPLIVSEVKGSRALRILGVTNPLLCDRGTYNLMYLRK